LQGMDNEYHIARVALRSDFIDLMAGSSRWEVKLHELGMRLRSSDVRAHSAQCSSDHGGVPRLSTSGNAPHSLGARWSLKHSAMETTASSRTSANDRSGEPRGWYSVRLPEERTSERDRRVQERHLDQGLFSTNLSRSKPSLRNRATFLTPA
jgi:hypothetical protein